VNHPAPHATEIRDAVRRRYAEAAQTFRASEGACDGLGPCCGTEQEPTPDAGGARLFGPALYDGQQADEASSAALSASLGCGVPTAVAALEVGETVLDLGSGAGGDVLLSARRVGSAGKVIGLDMTDEMLELARRNAADAAVDNVEFLKGYLEELPLPDASVDVVISNCVINLSAEKSQVLHEAARVLKPGGRLAVCDVIADPDMDDATRADMQQWTGCIAGAFTRADFEQALTAAGLIDPEITETHRVHEHAAAAIIRARKPAPAR